MTQVDVTPMLTNWGPWGVLIVALGVFVWRWVLPRIDRWIEQRRKDREAERANQVRRDDQFVQMISNNLEAAQKDREEERDRFLGLVDGTLKEQTNALSTLIKRVDEKLK